MIARRRRRCSWALLSLFAVVLSATALPALAELDPCCDEMQMEGGGHCESLSAASCCDCPASVYTSAHPPVSPTPAASAAVLPPPVHDPALRVPVPARLPDLRIALIRSVVLRL